MHLVRKIFLGFLFLVYFFICIFYPQLIFFYTLCLVLYILTEFFAQREKKKILCGGTKFFAPPQTWITDIVSIFYYANLHGKMITVTFGYSDFLIDEYNYIDQMNINTPVLYQTLKFFIESKNDNIIFFVNCLGFIEKIMWSCQFDISRLEKNQILITSTNDRTSRKYGIVTYDSVFMNMNRQAIYHFLYNFLNKN